MPDRALQVRGTVEVESESEPHHDPNSSSGRNAEVMAEAAFPIAEVECVHGPSNHRRPSVVGRRNHDLCFFECPDDGAKITYLYEGEVRVGDDPGTGLDSCCVDCRPSSSGEARLQFRNARKPEGAGPLSYASVTGNDNDARSRLSCSLQRSRCDPAADDRSCGSVHHGGKAVLGDAEWLHRDCDERSWHGAAWYLRIERAPACLVPRPATSAVFCRPGTPLAAFSASTPLKVRLRCAGLAIDIGSTRQLDSNERDRSIRVDQTPLPRHRHPERYWPRHYYGAGT